MLSRVKSKGRGGVCGHAPTSSCPVTWPVGAHRQQPHPCFSTLSNESVEGVWTVRAVDGPSPESPAHCGSVSRRSPLQRWEGKVEEVNYVPPTHAHAPKPYPMLCGVRQSTIIKEIARRAESEVDAQGSTLSGHASHSSWIPFLLYLPLPALGATDGHTHTATAPRVSGVPLVRKQVRPCFPELLDDRVVMIHGGWSVCSGKGVSQDKESSIFYYCYYLHFCVFILSGKHTYCTQFIYSGGFSCAIK